MTTFTVGLTGGIGSGKTAVSDYMKSLGVWVVDADESSRRVVEPGKPALEAIANHFGEDILLTDGSLDRAKLRQTIFAQPEEKAWLESLLHPLIGEDIINELARAEGHYNVLVSPLLLEIGQADLCQRVLVVDVPVEAQVMRTTARDNNSEDQVRKIIASQMDREHRRSRADDIVENDGDLQDLHRAVDALHKQYLEMSKAFAGNGDQS